VTIRRQNATNGFVQVAVLAGLVVVSGVLTHVLSDSRGIAGQAGAVDRLVVGRLSLTPA
jgi:hypothetical protein